VLLFSGYVTASALARPLWQLRRYQSSPLLERVECAERINARRSPDELDHLLELDGAELGHNLVVAALMEQEPPSAAQPALTAGPLFGRIRG